MNQSKAGKKLNPIIADFTTPIYDADPVRYQRICMWVWHQQKQGWEDEAIAEALKLAGANIHKVERWWSYLTKLLPKAKGRAAEAESHDHKSKDMAIAGEFVEFLKLRNEKKAT